VNFLRIHGIFNEAMMYCTRNASGDGEYGAEEKRTIQTNARNEKFPAWK